MNRYLFKCFSTLTLLFFFLSQSFAIASSCTTDIRQPISFAPGSYCWSFKGKATTFYGNFGVGQRITVTASGWNSQFGSWEALSLGAGDGNKFYVSDNSQTGELHFKTPHSGYYEFGFSPCYLWGAIIQFRVCAT